MITKFILLLFPCICYAQTYEEYRTFLINFEGYHHRVYLDKYCNFSVGVGHNISVDNRYKRVKIGAWFSKQKIENLFAEDLKLALHTAEENIPNFTNLDKNAKLVTVSLIFNVGPNGFKKFKYYIAALNGENPGNFDKKPNYLLASIELSGSLWAGQVGAERTQNHITLLKNAHEH